MKIYLNIFKYKKSKPDNYSLNGSITEVQEYENSHQTYGSPKITQVLNMKHKKVSRSYVARLMEKMNLKSKVRRKYKITIDSNYTYQTADNLLQRNFSANGLSQKWVSDITYIKTGKLSLFLKSFKIRRSFTHSR